MPYPKKKVEMNEQEMIMNLPKDFFERFKGKSFDEVLAMMANDDRQKGLMALSIIKQIKETGDPSSLKILTAALQRQGLGTERELPIDEERFREIIKVAARRI